MQVCSLEIESLKTIQTDYKKHISVGCLMHQVIESFPYQIMGIILVSETECRKH